MFQYPIHSTCQLCISTIKIILETTPKFGVIPSVSPTVPTADAVSYKQLKSALFDDEIIDKWVDYCMIEDESVSAKVTAEWLTDIGGNHSP